MHIQIFGINKENNENYSFMSVIAHRDSWKITHFILDIFDAEH